MFYVLRQFNENIFPFANVGKEETLGNGYCQHFFTTQKMMHR